MSGTLRKAFFWLRQCFFFFFLQTMFCSQGDGWAITQGLLTPSLADTQSFLVYHMHHLGDSSLFFLQCTLWKVSASLFAALPATCSCCVNSEHSSMLGLLIPGRLHVP